MHIDFLYAHPIETLLSTADLAWGIFAVSAIWGTLSLYAFAAYASYRTIHELILHSGVSVIPDRWMPLVGSSQHHFTHHEKLHGNYSSALKVLDKVFGTEINKKV